MVLGIKLEIDQGSVKKASKELSKDAGTGKRTRAKGVETGTTQKEGKEDGVGAFAGAALGGFVGAILGALEPIQEILAVIGGILKIALVPILQLMKPFLIVLLKMALWLMKIDFKKIINAIGDFFGNIGGWLDENILQPIINFVKSYIKFWINVYKFIWKLIVSAFGFLKNIGMWLWDNIIVPGFMMLLKIGKFLFDMVVSYFKFLAQVGKFLFDLIIGYFKFLARVGKFLFNLVVGYFKFLTKIGKFLFNLVVGYFEFLSRIGLWIWNFILGALGFIGDLGKKIWDFFLGGLSFLSDIGKRIWEFIKDALVSLNPFSSSHDDVLITSSGEVHDFSPDDNILAFKDFSTPASIGAGMGGNNITINVEGFVGSEDELADKISRALNNSSRGGTTNYS